MEITALAVKYKTGAVDLLKDSWLFCLTTYLPTDDLFHLGDHYPNDHALSLDYCHDAHHVSHVDYVDHVCHGGHVGHYHNGGVSDRGGVDVGGGRCNGSAYDHKSAD